MPFAFGQFEPRRNGISTRMPVSMGKYLSESFQQGWHDGLFDTIRRLEEFRITTGGAMLEPEDANAKYGLPGLNFTEPVNEERAALLHERHTKDLEREYYLTQGHRSFAQRGAGFATHMFASMLNPIDLGLAFVPITKGSMASSAFGRGAYKTAARRVINEGFIDLPKNLPARAMTSAAINNAVFQAAAEVPRFYEFQLEGRLEYTLLDSLKNIAMGTAIGVGIHAGVVGGLRILKRLGPETQDLLVRRAVHKFLAGEDFNDLHKLAALDKNLISDEIIANEIADHLARGEKIGPEFKAIAEFVTKTYKPSIRNIKQWVRLGLKTGTVPRFNKLTDKIAKKITEKIDFENIGKAVDDLKAKSKRLKKKFARAKDDAKKEAVLMEMQEVGMAQQVLSEISQYARGTGSQKATVKEQGFKPLFDEDGNITSEGQMRRQSMLAHHPRFLREIEDEVHKRLDDLITRDRASMQQVKKTQQETSAEAKPSQAAEENVSQSTMKENALPPEKTPAEELNTADAELKVEIEELSKDLKLEGFKKGVQKAKEAQKAGIPKEVLDTALRCVRTKLL